MAELFTYDPVGRILTVTDGEGATTTNTYDDLGRLIRVTQPVGGGQPAIDTSYGYNARGLHTLTVDGTYLAFLAELLETEVDSRTERRRQRRINEAKFPRLKRLVDFDLDAAPTINPATIATLAAGSYIAAGDPVVLLGDSGTGKSHLLIGLGHAACEQGLRVRYVTTAQLVNELAEAADERRLSRLVARYGRLDLLCLDELGYVQLDTHGSELLFQILTEREEKSSVAVASNLPVSEWGKVIPDARLVAAVIDRVTFNAHIIETGTESYLLRVTRQRRSTGGAKSTEHGGANPG